MARQVSPATLSPEVQYRPERSKTRPYIVRWTVNGKDRFRSFRTAPEAQRVWSEIDKAIRELRDFDPRTGLPVRAGGSMEPFYSFACDWTAGRWSAWQPRTRKSAIEAVSRSVVYLVKAGAPKPPQDLRVFLLDRLDPKVTGNPRAETLHSTRYQREEWAKRCDRWLTVNSLPLATIGVAEVGRAIDRLGTLLDGTTPAARTTATRYRTVLRSMLLDAVDQGLLLRDPWPRRRPQGPGALGGRVNVALLPSPEQIQEVLDLIPSSQPGSRAYFLLSTVCWHLGLRPSEALALDVSDFTLPAKGWGNVTVAKTFDGERIVPRTKTNSIRDVPVSPQLIGILRAELGSRTRGPLVQTVNGTVPPLGNWRRAVVRACDRLEANVLVDAEAAVDVARAAVDELRAAGQAPRSSAMKAARERLRAAEAHLHEVRQPGYRYLPRPMTLYDFRHANATFLLRLNIAAGEVALRLGHTVDVLLGTYAGVMVGDRSAANAAIEAALP